MPRFVIALLVWLAGCLPALAADAGKLELLMIESDGCIYCMRWDAEVAPEYPLTDEGRAAPLRRHNKARALPADVSLVRPAIFTPTFVLLRDGQELSRLEGYPSEDFFWPLLGEMIEKAQTGG